MSRLANIASIFFILTLGAAPGCSVEQEDGFGETEDEAREKIPGPLAKKTDAEVWTVENLWADKNTPSAKLAGMAWGANSGLTWEEKYRAWISSFEKIDGRSYGKTIRLKNPQGRTYDGPVLQCKDVAIWLRMSFASFYHLPFYMTGYHGGRLVYMGHFGVVDQSGDPVPGFPRFKAKYKDYEKTWQPGDPWPHDAALRLKHDGSDDGEGGVDAGGVKLSDSDGAGAYMDELFLNKRAGWLMHYLGQNFGSVNLADGANMYHIAPEATAVGDALIERWQKKGIGHTLPVMTSNTLSADKMRISVASGSMPRRQPLWEDDGSSASYFKSSYTGGEGMSSDTPPVPYAKLGGGIRRWRTPILVGSRWENDVPVLDRPVYIEDSNVPAIAARPARFGVLLAEDTPEGRRDAALAIINAARTSLHDHPSSCSQRTKREDGFKELYAVMKESFNKDAGAVDAEFRLLEDYVYAELEYTSSKTCCWNSTNAKMNEIIMDFAQAEQAAATANGQCKQPTVFKAMNGGYQVWKQFAATAKDGNGSLKYAAGDWLNWSEDEPCAQRDVAADALGLRGNVAFTCQQP